MKANHPTALIRTIQEIPEYAKVVRLGLLSSNSFGCWFMRAYHGTRVYKPDEFALAGAEFFDIFIDEDTNDG